MLTSDCPLAPVYCLRKDHKIVADPDTGPPMRPVCGATASYNGRLSHLMGKILQEVWKRDPDVCLSTEELMAGISEVNGKHLTEEVMVGSADVKALYPSLDIDFTIEKVCEMFYTSDVDFDLETIDTDELGLYISLNCDKQYLRENGLDQYCPSRKTNRGRRPVVTGCALEDNKLKRFSRWNYARSKPDVSTTCKMMVAALKISLLFIMKNHVYTFNNVIYRQKNGGPIGLDLTGVLAQVFMVWWDREFIAARDMGLRIHMYKRYVDDINIIMGVPDTLLLPHNGYDERCMNIVKSIADAIHPSIKVEVDHPSKHTDKKIPILDLKVWIEKRNGISIVLHEFYSKEVSSRSVVHPRSAMPLRVKRTIMTQEVLRVLLNCSALLPWERTVIHVNNMVARMQYSGYNEQFRYDVVKSALNARKTILSLEEQGERPLYRHKEWKRAEQKNMVDCYRTSV